MRNVPKRRDRRGDRRRRDEGTRLADHGEWETHVGNAIAAVLSGAVAAVCDSGTLLGWIVLALAVAAYLLFVWRMCEFCR